MTAEGTSEAEKIRGNNDAYCQTKLAEQMAAVADKNSESIKIEGDAESQLTSVLKQRREYEYLYKKLEVVKAIGRNSNVKIFGNTNDTAVN